MTKLQHVLFAGSVMSVDCCILFSSILFWHHDEQRPRHYGVGVLESGFESGDLCHSSQCISRSNPAEKYFLVGNMHTLSITVAKLWRCKSLGRLFSGTTSESSVGKSLICCLRQKNTLRGAAKFAFVWFVGFLSHLPTVKNSSGRVDDVVQVYMIQLGFVV